jgi:hypothetical protein
MIDFGSVFTQDIERENELQIKLILEWYLSITQHGHTDLPFGGTKGSVMLENFLKLELMNL